MICPICGKELPHHARKCNKCGCRPRYLYGRPKPPKWIWPAASAILAVIVAGVMFLPKLPESHPENFTVPLRTQCIANQIRIDYSYDENGNLLSVAQSQPYGAMVQFHYDEDGVLVGFQWYSLMDMLLSSSLPLSTGFSGTVEYDGEAREVTVLKARSDSAQSAPIVFKYDAHHRLTRITRGDSFIARSEFEYNQDGTLNTLTHWKQGTGGKIVQIELTYHSTGILDGFTVSTPGSSSSLHHCQLDEQGNVLEVSEVASPNASCVQYRYEYREVTQRTAKQYELQLYLLELLGLEAEALVVPFTQTPIHE